MLGSCSSSTLKLNFLFNTWGFSWIHHGDIRMGGLIQFLDRGKLWYLVPFQIVFYYILCSQ
jgi:hypothetical protein